MQINPVSNIPFKGIYSIKLKEPGDENLEFNRENVQKVMNQGMILGVLLNRALNVDKVEEQMLSNPEMTEISLNFCDSDDRLVERYLNEAHILYHKVTIDELT